MSSIVEPSRFRGLKYFPKSGVVYRNNLTQGPSKVGRIGTLKHNGYLEFTYKCKKYRVARVAIEIVLNRKLESYEIVDHINGHRDDNRHKNLRIVTQRKNCQNQKLHRGGKSAGWTFLKKINMYQAQLTVGGKSKYLGCFKTAEEAHQVYLNYLTRIESVE